MKATQHQQLRSFYYGKDQISKLIIFKECPRHGTTSFINAGLGNLFPNEPDIAWTQLPGFITGVLFLACYLVFQVSVRRNGFVLSSAFSSMSGFPHVSGLELVPFWWRLYY